MNYFILVGRDTHEPGWDEDSMSPLVHTNKAELVRHVAEAYGLGDEEVATLEKTNHYDDFVIVTVSI